MALKLKDNKYIRLILNDDINFEIYASESAREKYKNATPSALIIDKYEKLISEISEIISCYIKDHVQNLKFLENHIDKDSYLKNLFNKLDEVKIEYNNYCQALNISNPTGYEFPIMQQYYSDVADSIPFIIQKGYTLAGQNENLEDFYMEIKKLRRFGKTKDC